MPPTQFVAPNLWTLTGDGIYVRYSTIPLLGPAGGPHFIYQTLKFGAEDIRTVNVPDIGTLVSVTINMTIDTGSTTFTLLLPLTNIVQQGPVSSIPVTTEGITTTHAGPFTPPVPFGHGQQEFYTVTQLTGTASHVMAE